MIGSPNRLPIDPQARLLRNAEHWARAVSNQFDDACIACGGSIRFVASPVAPRLEGHTDTGGTVLLRIEAGNIVMTRIELTNRATIRLPLPARLARQIAD